MAPAIVAMVTPAAAALQTDLGRIVPQINEKIAAVGKKAAGIMQPAVDSIVEICLNSGLAVRRNVMPRNTGIHPENRGKTGVDPFNAQTLT